MKSVFRAIFSAHPLSHWHDYGDILYNGMTGHLDRKNGALQLARTGPYVPDVFTPGSADILITDSVKRQLEAMIPSLIFVPVAKVHIVKLDWHAWDLSADDLPEYPESGEPEDLILGREHDPALSEAIGPIWELAPTIDTGIQGEDGCFVSARYDGQHIVRADIHAGYNFVSDELRSALQAVAPGRIDFVSPLKKRQIS